MLNRLICRLIGHDPYPVFSIQVCHCSPTCRGTYRKFQGHSCHRCWDRLPEHQVPA